MNKFENNLIITNSRKSFLKKHFNSIIFLLLLTTIVSLITYYRILVQIEIGPLSDSLVFLANALVFSGNGTGYSNLLFPPFFPFIVSLFFRLGFISASAIFVLDGVLFVFGVIGLFLLLKTRFNDLESFLGGLLYATFPTVLIVLGLGFSDIVSVSFTIWAFYFLVLAVKNDSKFFYLAFPFVMFAFLTRYNSGLIIFPILLYILINKNKINFKDVFFGITASFLIIVPVLIFFYEKFGNMIYPFINFGSTSMIVSVATENPYYNPNVLFFLQMLPAFFDVQGLVILLFVALGGLFLLPKFIRKILDYNNSFDRFKLKNRVNNIKWSLFVVLVFIFLVSFGNVVYILSELIFVIIAFLFYDLTKNLNLKNLNLNIMVFAWFMTFFIFHSVFVIKDYRYFVLLAPPLAFLMILGLNEIYDRMKFKIRNRNLVFPIIAIILTSIMLLSTASQITLIQKTNHDNKIINDQLNMASQWFVNYDPNYKNENIYSDWWPNFSWYLKTNVKPVPVFKNNKSYYAGINDQNISQQDSNELNKYLDGNNASYYFSVRQGLNLTSYMPIKQYGIVTIYQKNN